MRRTHRPVLGTIMTTATVSAALALILVVAVTDLVGDDNTRTTLALTVVAILAAVALIVATGALRRTARTRTPEAVRPLDLDDAHIRGMRTRAMDAARLLAAEDATLRLTGVYEMLAVADEWCRTATRGTHVRQALIEHQRCLDMICGYLRANRRLERFVPGTRIDAGEERDEREVREQFCAGLARHLQNWRRLGPFLLDLSGADLAGMRLCNSTFAGLTARGATLIETDLTGADLSGADLTDVSAASVRLVGANLTGAVFLRASAPGASCNGADATDSVFTDAHLRGAHFLDTTLTGTDFTRADLRAAKLQRADLSTTVLDSAELTGADLTDTTPEAVSARPSQGRPAALVTSGRRK